MGDRKSKKLVERRSTCCNWPLDAKGCTRCGVALQTNQENTNG